MSKIREILDNLSTEQYKMMIGEKSCQPLTETFSKKRVVHPGANGQMVPPVKQQEIWLEYMQRKGDKSKKKDKRSEDFDASCFFSGHLIVNKRTSLLLSEKLKDQIEVLPVNVVGNTSDYYFINVLNTVKALDTESKSNEEILMMVRENNCVFSKKNIESYIIFRDSIFNGSYYCTDEFIDLVKQNSITGLKFTCAGIAE